MRSDDQCTYSRKLLGLPAGEIRLRRSDSIPEKGEDPKSVRDREVVTIRPTPTGSGIEIATVPEAEAKPGDKETVVHMVFRDTGLEIGNTAGKPNCTLTRSGDIQTQGKVTVQTRIIETVEGKEKINDGNTTVVIDAKGIALSKIDKDKEGGTLSFGESHGPKINLWQQVNAIGVQDSTTYFRTSFCFAWYAGGSHKHGKLDEGGGTVVMATSGGNVGIGTKADDKHRLWVNGKSKLDGNVGIGANAHDTRRLTVQGESKLDGSVGIGIDPETKYKLKISGSLLHEDRNTRIETDTNGITLTRKDKTTEGGTLRFGKDDYGPKISLWEATHEIGIQDVTTYFRTSSCFAWYAGGTHNGGKLEAGGGTVVMATLRRQRRDRHETG